jgi:hypothetical protein
MIFWLVLKLEISYKATTRRTSSLLFLKKFLVLVSVGCASFAISLAFPFCLPWDGFDYRVIIT